MWEPWAKGKPHPSNPEVLTQMGWHLKKVGGDASLGLDPFQMELKKWNESVTKLKHQPAWEEQCPTSQELKQRPPPEQKHER